MLFSFTYLINYVSIDYFKALFSEFFFDIATLNKSSWKAIKLKLQKQPTRVVFRKRCFENMKQICKRTYMLNCDFNKVA